MALCRSHSMETVRSCNDHGTIGKKDKRIKSHQRKKSQMDETLTAEKTENMKVISLKESDNHSGMASPHVTAERQEIGPRGDNEKTRTGERETTAVEPEEAEINIEVQSAENIQIEEDGQIKATRGRKRTRNEENWTRNIRKRLQNSGKDYTSSRGKQVAGKELKAPCTEKMSFQMLYKVQRN